MTDSEEILIECDDCSFEYRTHDPKEAFEKQVKHDIDRGHVTIKQIVEANPEYGDDNE